MANTKNLDPKARKRAKRKMRLEQKHKLAQLTVKERKELKKFEGSTKQFLKEREAKLRQAGAESSADTPAEGGSTES
jgi:hypothetical protein